MDKRYILSIAMLFACMLLVPSQGMAQRGESVTIESVVRSEDGTPVQGAVVYGNEGTIRATTDAEGRFEIVVPNGQADLYIQADGYASEVFAVGDSYTLRKLPFGYTEKDDVNVAFGKVKRGDLVNAVTVLNADDILYTDNNLNLQQALAGRVPGLMGTSNIRGLGNALFLVDGLPRDINTINLAEVEQITVLKDVNSAILYGNHAANGVVHIKTKRGQPHKKDVRVTGYYGFSRPTALPEYLSSAEYAELYNEARVNDGLAPQYSDEQIANYRTGNPYIYPDIDYYSSEYLKSAKPFFKLMTELSGGNDVARYYTNLGWDQTGSLLNFGNGLDARRNIFNVRGNVDVNINHWVTTALDATFVLNSNKTPVGNYWADAATKYPNLLAPLLPISMIDPSLELLTGRKSDVNGLYMVGGDPGNLSNPIADVYLGGHNERIQRTFSFNNRIDFDFEKLADLKGLAFHTNISFDLFTRFDQSITNGYAVYEPTWNPEETQVIGLTRYGEDVRTGSQNISNQYYERRVGFYGMLDYNRTFDNIHHITGSLLGFAHRHKWQGVFQPNKNANLGLRLTYGYDNRYLVDFSSAYVASAKLPEGNRGAFSPSLGLAWVLSSEEFLAGSDAVDYLKLRFSGGIMNTDAGIGGYYYYDNIYSNSGRFNWFEGNWGNNGVVSTYGGNPNLSFEKRKEINVGFQGIFFDNLLHVDANVFRTVFSDIVTRPQTQFPSYYANFIPFQNFDENAYRGLELGLSVHKAFGDVSVALGANALFASSEVLRRDEIYMNDYQNRTGHPVDAMFGLVADGLFMDQAEIDNHAIQAFGTVRPGDIKYVDQNNDGVIDANDEVRIGRYQAPFSYGLNLTVSYGNFSLFALGTGSKGADSFLSGDYYWVDGSDKYSAVVRDRWTEATKNTATYPRLSSQASTNNFRNSTFWLYENNYFNLSRLQLTYQVPEGVAQMFRMKHLNFYVDASNVFTISKHREVRDLRIGAEPYYRSYSLGARILF